jgi:hypothetical protein
MVFRQCNNEEEKTEDGLLNVVVLENKVIVYCKKTKIILGTFFSTVQESLPASSSTKASEGGRESSVEYSTWKSRPEWHFKMLIFCIKGTEPRDGYCFEGLSILISTFCVLLTFYLLL